MKTIATLLLVLTSTVQAQEPTEEQKKAALMEAYRLNGNSMVRDPSKGSIDLSHPHAPPPDIACVEAQSTGHMFYECQDYSRPVKTERMPPLSRADLDRNLVAPPLDCKKVHGVRNDERCKQ